MLNYNENYIVHKYTGEVYNVTLKELFTSFNAYSFLRQFGYGTDYGKYLTAYGAGRKDVHCFSPHDAVHCVYYKYLFFITTNDGKLLQPEQVLTEYCIKYDPNNYWYCGRKRYLSTGSKRRYGRCFRHMKTTAERRVVAGVLTEEGEPEFRGSRKNLPSCWDDYHLSTQRSWKKQTKRKQQYKGS